MNTEAQPDLEATRLEYNDPDKGTGIYVRARSRGKWGSHDIAALDKPSLLAWLKSRGGDNQVAEDVVGHLLGYGPLNETIE